MMITPAILAKTESEFQEKVDRVRALGLPLHVDVLDGSFVPQVGWADPMKVEQIVGELDFEVHLMVSNPEHAVIVWLATKAKRVWFHVESTDRIDMIMRAAPNDIGRLGLVISPETPISYLSHYLDQIPAVLIMGVTPGASGQAFQDIALEKIEQLKRLRPNLWVKVDGGVKPENIAKIRDIGADAVATASALTENPDISLAYARLQQALNGFSVEEEAPAPVPESDVIPNSESSGTPPAAPAAVPASAEPSAPASPPAAPPTMPLPDQPPAAPTTKPASPPAPAPAAQPTPTEQPEPTADPGPASAPEPASTEDPEPADLDIFESPADAGEKPNP